MPITLLESFAWPIGAGRHGACPSARRGACPSASFGPARRLSFGPFGPSARAAPVLRPRAAPVLRPLRPFRPRGACPSAPSALPPARRCPSAPRAPVLRPSFGALRPARRCPSAPRGACPSARRRLSFGPSFGPFGPRGACPSAVRPARRLSFGPPSALLRPSFGPPSAPSAPSESPWECWQKRGRLAEHYRTKIGSRDQLLRKRLPGDYRRRRERSKREENAMPYRRHDAPTRRWGASAYYESTATK